MSIGHHDLPQRTQEYAQAVKRFGKPLFRIPHLRDSAGQLLRASSSAAANYLAAGVARSNREFIAKLGIAVEEAEETVMWLNYIGADEPVDRAHLGALVDEGRQISRILKATRLRAIQNAQRRLDSERRRPEGPRVPQKSRRAKPSDDSDL